ncbi:MAG: shikimate kinase [Tissierellia bacterium]|nr:shikimate kinase [Tissierellia bacterium]
MKYGLLGKTLGHSLSPKIHGLFADYSYELFEREEDQIEELLADPKIQGLNVTIPYKETVLKFCNTLTDRARSIGCVNTIVIDKNRQITGDNTDFYGFDYLLERMEIPHGKDLGIIIGDGATSKTVSAVLRHRGIPFVILSRSTKPFLSDAKAYAHGTILINTTPVGMYPHNGKTALSLDPFPKLKAVVDVIYNPLRSELLLQAKERGIPYSGGLPMLVAQAKAAAELFTGTKISDEKTEEVLRQLQQESQNIVLVGMPGSGKTTVGKRVAKLTGKTFIDLDHEIVRRERRSIPQIFEESGEAHFRKLERQVTEELGKKLGVVLATGGGVILDPRNKHPLAQNGRIYWIDRNIKKLATKDRPLSKNQNSLFKMYRIRKPKYRDFADVYLRNVRFNVTAERIVEDFYENTDD